MVLDFVLVLAKCCKLDNNLYLSSNEKTSLKFRESFRTFLNVFIEKNPDLLNWKEI